MIILAMLVGAGLLGFGVLAGMSIMAVAQKAANSKGEE